VEDYQIQFARDLLGRAPYNERAKLLEAAKGLVQERKALEEERLRKRFADLGIDWSSGPSTGTPRASVTVTPSGDREVRAGETVRWTVTVENHGDAPLRQLRAWTTSEKNLLLDRREFVFGTIRPGERRSWSVTLKIPKSFDSRRDEVTLHFESAGKAIPDTKTTLHVVEIPKPVFAFSLQLDDAKGGNGDGLPQRGETFTVKVDVKNAGPGASGEKTYVSLKNLGDEKAFIVKGREVIGAVAPGESMTAAMEIELRKGSKSEALSLRVAIVDEKNDEWAQEKVEFPIAADGTLVTPVKGAIRFEAAEALLRSGASASAVPIATVKRGAILPTDARVGDFFRVEWKKGRFAFASEADVRQVAGGRQGAITAAWQHEPPRITLDPDPGRGAPSVDGDSFKLSGVAAIPPSSDPDARLRDVFVFVNDKKVFFKVVPENQTSPRMEFQADLPLKPGNNLVTVFAREDEDFQTRRSFYVLRRSPPQAAQAGQPAQPAK
jgi:carboxyl-terminal processing protease